MDDVEVQEGMGLQEVRALFDCAKNVRSGGYARILDALSVFPLELTLKKKRNQ